MTLIAIDAYSKLLSDIEEIMRTWNDLNSTVLADRAGQAVKKKKKPATMDGAG